jgi:hypothetical protein
MRRRGLLLLVLRRRVRFDALLLRRLVQIVRMGMASHRPYRNYAHLRPSVLVVVLCWSRKRVLDVGLVVLWVGGDHGEVATACHHERLGTSGCGSRGSP